MSFWGSIVSFGVISGVLTIFTDVLGLGEHLLKSKKKIARGSPLDGPPPTPYREWVGSATNCLGRFVAGEAIITIQAPMVSSHPHSIMAPSWTTSSYRKTKNRNKGGVDGLASGTRYHHLNNISIPIP